VIGKKTGMKAKIDKISGQFAGVCDFLLPQASSEMDYLMQHSPKGLPHFRLLPNGCDPELYTQADPSLFEKTHGLRDFLLCVGRIEPNKNQLLLCYALRETDIPIVLVGKESSDLFQDYLALCKISWEWPDSCFARSLRYNVGIRICGSAALCLAQCE
jgi:glycosyltransferase involved in cell wall biosynthesis